MQIDEHIAYVRAEGDRLAEIVARTDPAAPTPTCPDWTVGELARHTGRVHRWAATIVRTAVQGEPTPGQQQAWWGPMPDDAELADWVGQGVAGLVAALSTAPPDLASWTFLPAPSPLAFWARRQAHETTIHRVDAQYAADGHPGDPVPTALAVDGIDELLLAFYSRPRNRIRSPQPRSLGVVATDTDASWVVRVSAEGAHSERLAAPPAADSLHATVAAPASSLYLGLWNRGPLEPTGDPELIELWRGTAQIRWA